MEDWSGLPHRIRRAFRLALRRSDLTEADVDAELSFHLRARIETLEAQGMSLEQAEREALRRFGPMNESRRAMIAAAERRERRLSLLERLDVVQYELTHVFRRLRRAPGVTSAVIITFALGIGVNATMFDIMDRLLLRSPPHVAEAERLVMVGHRGDDPDGNVGRSFSIDAYRMFRETGVFDRLAVMSLTVELPLGRGSDASRASALFVNGSYFVTLGVRPVVGRFFGVDEDPDGTGVPVAVISHALWQRHFDADRGVLGRELDLGRGRYTIIGVAPAGFRGLGLTTVDVWLPVATSAQFAGTGPGLFAGQTAQWLRLVGRLRDGVTEAAAATALTPAYRAAVASSASARARSVTMLPVPRNERAFGELEDVKVPILVWAASALILIMACVNVANLLLAQGQRRLHETAVRLALGIGRWRLVGQHLLEALVLSAAGSLAALTVVTQAGRVLRGRLFAGVQEADPTIDGRLLAYLACAGIVAGALAGLVPAIRSARPSLVSALKSGTRGGRERSARMRNTLTAAQAGVSFLLLVGAGLFVRSLRNVEAIPLGMEPQRVLFARMNLRAVGHTPAEVDGLFALMADRVRHTPGIENAAVAVTVPFWSTYPARLTRPGRDAAQDSALGAPFVNAISPTFLETIGTRLLRGRPFGPTDGATTAPVAIVNDALARRYWPGEDALGRCVRVGARPDCATIVGVAEDVRQQNITGGEGDLQVYVPITQAPPTMTIRVMVVRPAGDLERAVPVVRHAMQSAASGLPYAQVEPFTRIPDLAGEMRPWRMGGIMFAAFGGLALLLGGIGLYAVTAQAVGQRVHEMGVRRALGATGDRIAFLVLRQGLHPVLLGAFIGSGVAALAGSAVSEYLFRVSPRDPEVFAMVTAVLGLAATAACVAPTIRALRVDPSTALRHE